MAQQQQQQQPPNDLTDPFDTLLTLEDSLYTTAYTLGSRDGARAGRIEGRVFGLEKGFEKFAALGQLHGRACVWGARVPSLQSAQQSQAQNPSHLESQLQTLHQDQQDVLDSGSEVTSRAELQTLPPLPTNSRLAKHVKTLHSLTDPATFSTLNTEEAVADYDDRFKRAGAKTKVIERIVGETDDCRSSNLPGGAEGSEEVGNGNGNGKGKSNLKVAGEDKRKKQGGKTDNMEDFTGGRLGI